MECREPSLAYNGRRVRLIRVEEDVRVAVEQFEVLQRIGKEGVANALMFDGENEGYVNILFDDGMRLNCLLEGGCARNLIVRSLNLSDVSPPSSDSRDTAASNTDGKNN